MISKEEYIVGGMSEVINAHLKSGAQINASLLLELKVRVEQWSEEYDERYVSKGADTYELKEKVSAF